MKRLLVLIIAAVGLSSCGIYSFSGTSIQPDINTITINFFEYKAMKVNPSLSNDLTEALKNNFRRMTKLEQVESDGDLEISGTVTNYTVTAQAITAQEMAAMNRLTVTVSITFENKKYPEDNFENKSFSAYLDYDSSDSLDSVESSRMSEITDKLIEDIFNATVAQW